MAWFGWSVLKEGNSATFGILEFVLLAEIIAGDASSHDKK